MECRSAASPKDSCPLGGVTRPQYSGLRLISLPRPMQRYDDWGNPIKGNLLGVNPKAFRRKLKKKYIRFPADGSISKSLLLILQ